jgi:hypothetical protein
MNVPLTDTKKLLLFTDSCETLWENGTCCSDVVWIFHVQKDRYQGKVRWPLVLCPVMVRCLLLAAISPARHAEWLHMSSSEVSSSNDGTMEMAKHISAFHLEVYYVEKRRKEEEKRSRSISLGRNRWGVTCFFRVPSLGVWCKRSCIKEHVNFVKASVFHEPSKWKHRLSSCCCSFSFLHER